MASAAFEISINGGAYAAGPAIATAGQTVACRLVSVLGLNPSLIAFGFTGWHTAALTTTPPVITLSGSPNGQIRTFTMPATPVFGQAAGMYFTVEGGEAVTGIADHTAKSAVYVLDENGAKPFFVGETSENSGVGGWTERVNAKSGADVMFQAAMHARVFG